MGRFEMRVRDEDMEAWKKAAGLEGRSVAEWLQKAAKEHLTPKDEAAPTLVREIGDDGLDPQQREARAKCSQSQCGHVRHLHRGLGGCCQVLACACLGFDGAIVRSEVSAVARAHSPGCKCDVCVEIAARRI
jgi:hypothetical protein